MDVKQSDVTVAVENNRKKTTPTFCRENYPYKAVGDVITDFESLEPHGVLYEIECPKCEMNIRTQGCNVKRVYEKLLNGVQVKNEDGSVRTEGGKGCIGCGSRELVVKKIDMTQMAEAKASRTVNSD